MDPNKPHECPFCEAKYHRMASLAKHVLEDHQTNGFVNGKCITQEPSVGIALCWCNNWFGINRQNGAKYVSLPLMAQHWKECGGLTQHVLNLTFEAINGRQAP